MNGVFATKNCNKILIELLGEVGNEELLIHIRGKNLLALRQFGQPVLDDMKDMIQDQWPGLVYTGWILCPVCVKLQVPNPTMFEDNYLGNALCISGTSFLHCLTKHSQPVAITEIYPLQGKSLQFHPRYENMSFTAFSR